MTPSGSLTIIQDHGQDARAMLKQAEAMNAQAEKIKEDASELVNGKKPDMSIRVTNRNGRAKKGETK